MNEAPKLRIALLPGDGIGAEVIEAGVEVLRAVESSLGKTRFGRETYEKNYKGYYAETRRGQASQRRRPASTCRPAVRSR